MVKGVIFEKGFTKQRGSRLKILVVWFSCSIFLIWLIYPLKKVWWYIISKWSKNDMFPQRPLLTKEHRPFGRGPTTALSGLKNTMVISYLLTRNDPPIRAELADAMPVVHHDVTVSMSRWCHVSRCVDNLPQQQSRLWLDCEFPGMSAPTHPNRHLKDDCWEGKLPKGFPEKGHLFRLVKYNI